MQEEEYFDFTDFEYFIELEAYSARLALKRDNTTKRLQNQQSILCLFNASTLPDPIQEEQ